MGVIFSAVISLSAAERNCARQALKGLRNGISCSTGSALTLAIVRSYYRLLAAKGDNAASRSGKTQAFIDCISRRKSLLAARVGVSGVASDLCPGREVPCGSQSGWEQAAHRSAPRGSQGSTLGTAQHLWTAVLETAAWERIETFLCSSASR